MSVRSSEISPRIESAILRNLLAETLAAYEADRGAPATAPGTGTKATARRSPALGARRFGLADVKAENGVLRHLLVATSRAYEERLNALRVERDLVRQLLAAVSEAVLAVDAAGVLIRFNRAAEELTGWTPSEACGRPLGDVLRIVGARGRQVTLDLSPCLQEGKQMAMRRSLQAVGRDGRSRAVTGRVAPIRGRRREVLGAVLVLSLTV